MSLNWLSFAAPIIRPTSIAMKRRSQIQFRSAAPTFHFNTLTNSVVARQNIFSEISLASHIFSATQRSDCVVLAASFVPQPLPHVRNEYKLLF